MDMMRKTVNVDFGVMQTHVNLVDLEMLQKWAFVAKIGFDTTETEPLKADPSFPPMGQINISAYRQKNKAVAN